MREIALHMADIAENSLAAGAARIKLSVMIDRAPLGSIADTMAALIAANPETDFTLEYAADGKAFAFATDTIPYHDRTPAFAAAAKKEIQQRIDEINGGAEPI